MKKTTVTEVSYQTYQCRITEYACDKCGSVFLDYNDNYQYCPYCGRKIVDKKELVK